MWTSTFRTLSEMLEEEEQICVNRETLRPEASSAGIGKRRYGDNRVIGRGGSVLRRWVKCSLSLDGSPHRWIGRGESSALLCTDDATGKPSSGALPRRRTLRGALRSATRSSTRYGLPSMFYLDRASRVYDHPAGTVSMMHQRDEQPYAV